MSENLLHRCNDHPVFGLQPGFRSDSG